MPAIDTDILRAILHSQLEQLSPQAREASAALAIEKLNTTLEKARIPSLPPLPPAEDAKMQKHLKEMQEDGISLLGPILSPKQIKDVHNYLDTKNVYTGHVWTFSDRVGRPKSAVKETHRQACYLLEDSLKAPHLIETISNPGILKLVEQYLGGTPTVFQSNLLWSFEKRPDAPAVAQYFHRDWDNFRFCVLFVYMTDVDKQTGPHQYVRGSHTLKGMEASIKRHHEETGDATWKAANFYHEGAGMGDRTIVDEVFKKDITQIEKPAGHAFLSDAFGLHRGLPLEKGERLLFWARYGLYDNGFSVDVSPGPLPRAPFEGRIPDDPTHRYIFRAILESEFTQAPNFSIHAVPPSFNVLYDELLHRYGKRAFVRRAARVLLHEIRDKSAQILHKLKKTA